MNAAVKGIWGAVLAAALVLPAAAQASDDFNHPTPIAVNGLQVRDVTGANAQTDEPLTPFGEGLCSENGTETDHTEWFQFTAPGGPTVLTTEGSDFDTQLALYFPPAPATFGNFLGCANDRADLDPIAEGQFDAVAGQSYLLQVGACDDDNYGTCPSKSFGRSGTAWVAVLTNDDRAHPETLTPGSGTRTNAGATADPGTELTSCGAAEYDKTVWFRYVAPAEGDVTFSTSAFDTVISAYQGSTRVACNDDAGDSNSSEIKFHVAKGAAYLLQVGGKSTVDGIYFGGFTYRLAFAEDFDHDNDGYNRAPGPDCNDNNPNIHPNAPSIAGNGVDENCDGSDPPLPVDADHDGSPAGQDCDDHDPLRTPGKPEIRGNGIDEDCVGGDLPLRQIPTTLGLSPIATRSTQLRDFVLSDIPRGATVRITCRGKGCQRKRYTRRFPNGAGHANLTRAMRRNRPRSGAVMDIRISAPESLTKVIRLRFRFYLRPRVQQLCQPPGATKPTHCSQ